MDIKTRLLMSFKDTDGKMASIAVDSPRTDVTEEDIHSAMSLILAKNIFAPGGGKFESMVEAKIVQTDTTEYDLVF